MNLSAHAQSAGLTWWKTTENFSESLFKQASEHSLLPSKHGTQWFVT